MSGFKVGDVVVCLHVEPRGTDFDGSLCLLRPRGVYRITSVDWDGGIGIKEARSTHPDGFWWSGRFRKIQKADNAFTAQMRALKSIKQQA